MKRTLSIILAAAFTMASATAQFVPSGQGKGYGPKDGTGYQGNGPKDGTGYGAKAGKRDGTGPNSGTCDRTGPKGAQRGGQSRGGRR